MGFISKVIGIVAMFAGLVLGIAILFSLPVWLLWNWLMPTIFGVTKISIFQAFGILLLSGILFRSNSAKQS